MAEIEQRFGLQVPSSTRNLALIRDFVARVAEQAQLDETDVASLEVAVDEACANVIEHAYGQDLTKEVTVRATIDEDSISIHVIDEGRGFDPTAVEPAGIGELMKQRKRGGLGLRLMKKLVDEIHYEVEPGKKNELRMVKRRRRPG